jgi:hypothetical protein
MIVHIIAEDLQLRGVDSGHLTAGETEKLVVVPAPKAEGSNEAQRQRQQRSATPTLQTLLQQTWQRAPHQG